MNGPRSNVNRPIEKPHMTFCVGTINVCLICHCLQGIHLSTFQCTKFESLALKMKVKDVDNFAENWHTYLLSWRANVCVCVCVCVCACICVCVCKNVYVKNLCPAICSRWHDVADIRTYEHTYIRTYIHTYIRTYVHTYIRTYSKVKIKSIKGPPQNQGYWCILECSLMCRHSELIDWKWWNRWG